MEDSNVLYYINKGIERLQENCRFPPESIVIIFVLMMI